jgi:uncharacterized damage-inducible protein DinB
MSRRKELRAQITDARAKAHRALVEVGGGWEKPGAGTEGEAAWSARQAVEHLAAAEVFFASVISVACGYPALDLERYSFETPAEAAEQYARATAKADSILQHVTDDDLAKDVKDGRMQGMTVEQLLALTASHTAEHAEQASAAAVR